MGGKTSTEAGELFNLPTSTINRIYNRAIERGFDPDQRPLQIFDSQLADASRSGRPSKRTEEVKAKVVNKVRLDRSSLEKTCVDIAGELSSEGHDISAMTVWRILRGARLKKTKLTWKPGLT